MKSKFQTAIAAIFLAVLPFQAFAWSQYQPSDCCDLSFDCCEWFCKEWNVGAELLVWKPCVDELDYAAITTPTSVTYKSICPDWAPGFRAYAGKEDFLCGWDVEFSYAYLSTDAKNVSTRANGQVLSSPYFYQINLDAPTLTGTYDIQFHDWDALFLTQVGCSPCVSFYPYIGATGIYLSQGETITGRTGDTVLFAGDWKRDYWGVGLKAGSYFERPIGFCFSLFGDGSISALWGRPSNSALVQGIRVEEETCCLTVPELHIKTGVKYKTELCCQKFEMIFGYEYLILMNLPNPRRPSGTGDYARASSPDIRTIGFNGLFTGLNFIF